MAAFTLHRAGISFVYLPKPIYVTAHVSYRKWQWSHGNKKHLFYRTHLTWRRLTITITAVRLAETVERCIVRWQLSRRELSCHHI